MANFDGVKIPQKPINEKHNLFEPPPAKKKRKWKWLVLILILVVAAGWAVIHVASKANQIFTGGGNIFGRFASLVISPDKPLIGEDQGEVNILLMGVGGNGHDGAYLTDTMIVAQINTKTNEVVLTSIPRDFALTLPKYGYNKINAAYAYTYRDDQQNAGQAAIDAAEKVTGLTIPYYAVIDFKGFVKAVDDVGGVDVVVDNTFTDATFPNDYPYDTKGYLAPVTFTKGPAHMDGHTALIFARSRHSGNNNEGSDFARSERQKKIIIALKNKVLGLKLTSLTTINNLLSDFTDNFRTNMEPYELKRVADLAQKINASDIYSFSLEPQDNLICSALVDPATGKRPLTPVPAPVPAAIPTPTPPVSPATPGSPSATPVEPQITLAYVVQPCEGKTLDDIHQFVTQAPILAKLKSEGAVVEIQSSLHTPISPAKFKQLADDNINVRYATFTGKTAYDQTLLYDNSRGSKPKTLALIQDNYHFPVSDVTLPSSTADFVIILGKN